MRARDCCLDKPCYSCIRQDWIKYDLRELRKLRKLLDEDIEEAKQNVFL